MNSKNGISGISRDGLKAIAGGVIWAYVLMIILAVLSSGVIYFGNLDEMFLKPAGILIAVAALFYGGFSAGRQTKSRGLLFGLAVGALFCLTVLLIMLVSKSTVGFAPLKGLYYLLAAAAGGVVGVK
ncbi:MAG: TIGR04086 family membrane protein [Clostridiales bacterium]|nr:TIGR04086 family membrane protein [Clostridiales bacterium]